MERVTNEVQPVDAVQNLPASLHWRKDWRLDLETVTSARWQYRLDPDQNEIIVQSEKNPNYCDTVIEI